MSKSHNTSDAGHEDAAPTGLRRVMISGGGTGGHIFPALTIANEIKRRFPTCQILFVGAEHRMEAERVPAAGYQIVLLPVRGLPRGRNPIAILRSLYLLLRSIRIAQRHIRNFRPQAVIGVGGYASAPTLLAASRMSIPTMVQEQNSYAGVTNKLVGRRAKAVWVAYKDMERFFPKCPRVVLTGNPVRSDLVDTPRQSVEAYAHFGLDRTKKTLLILGGSLGARSINDAIIHQLSMIAEQPEVQIIWQCGKAYANTAATAIKSADMELPHLYLTDFIPRMDLAYSVADLVISRAGASSISELTLLGLPMILVPSPNVAEDHQTKNATALTDDDAAIIVRDQEATELLIPTAFEIIHDTVKLQQLSQRAKQLGKPNATTDIVDDIEAIATQSR